MVYRTAVGILIFMGFVLFVEIFTGFLLVCLKRLFQTGKSISSAPSFLNLCRPSKLPVYPLIVSPQTSVASSLLIPLAITQPLTRVFFLREVIWGDFALCRENPTKVRAHLWTVLRTMYVMAVMFVGPGGFCAISRNLYEFPAWFLSYSFLQSYSLQNLPSSFTFGSALTSGARSQLSCLSASASFSHPILRP